MMDCNMTRTLRLRSDQRVDEGEKEEVVEVRDIRGDEEKGEHDICL